VFKLIHQYSDIITAYKVSRFEHFGDILRIRAEFVLSDHSTLYVRETVLSYGSRLTFAAETGCDLPDGDGHEGPMIRSHARGLSGGI